MVFGEKMAAFIRRGLMSLLDRLGALELGYPRRFG
jgi:hypothetical protein